MPADLYQCCANRMLAALPRQELVRLQPALDLVSLRRGQMLAEPGRRLSHVYFPASAIVSLYFSTPTGDASDVALTGADGMVGVSVFATPDMPAGAAIVQRPGLALRAASGAVRDEFARGGSLQMLALRYQLLLMSQIAQTALCNRHHRVEQQLARWLLMSLDCTPDAQLEVTQQQLAAMLGVRREGVSAAASRLQRAGVLLWTRGRVRVIDRAALEHVACECYAATREQARRLLPPLESPAPRLTPLPA